MAKRIYFNAFHMNCIVHQSPGLWVRPDDKMLQYTDLHTWVELARLLERGKFDALFLADVVGVYDVYRGSRETALTGRAGPSQRPYAADSRDGVRHGALGIRVHTLSAAVPSVHL